MKFSGNWSLGEYAPLGYELKELIVNEFSRGNKVYLSILQAIASDCQTVTEIAKAVAIPPTSVAKYIIELEKRKYLINRRTPIGTADPSRSKYGKYYLCSYFDNFWFKFIQPDLITYEMCEFDKMLFNVAQKLPAYFQGHAQLVVKELMNEFRNKKAVESILASSTDEIGEAWNRDVSVDLAVLDSKNDIIRLGDVIGPERGGIVLQIDKFITNTDTLKKFYHTRQMERFLVSWDHLDAKTLKTLADNDIKCIYLKELLGLADYHPKPLLSNIVKPQRIKKTDPAKSASIKKNKTLKKTNRIYEPTTERK
jgi:DNA-binding Lrp family transcriptional regulator